MNLLTVSAITKHNSKGFVLQPVSFTQQYGQKIAIAGETGSGKTTMLRIIAGLIQSSGGAVYIEGERVLGPDEKLLPGHPKIGYLSQHFELRNNYRVEELLEMFSKLDTVSSAKIHSVCRIEHLLKRRTDELSGGEKQRIALAIQLVTLPKLLLLDEPFSNLDLLHKQVIKNVIEDISTVLKITCMLVSHDPLDILAWADEIVIMKNGEIIQRGSAFDLYRHPVNEYAAGILGKYNLLDVGENSSSFEKILLRPEDLEITTEAHSKIKATVKKVNFYGGYYELELMAADKLLVVRTNAINYKVNDEVYLTFDMNNASLV